jgi:nitroimidazol reductase NimA-like FMN-containing flavoprotein (pyridoxamine 5'-phosphate oxidase superfamily)
VTSPERSEARDTSGLAALDRDECLRLLASVSVGRLVFTEHAMPAVTPVRFLVHDETIVIPHDGSGKLTAAADGVVVAFEVDEFDSTTRVGWSVTVVGRAGLVTDTVVGTRLAARALDKLALRDHTPFVRIRAVHVTGRRIGSAADTAGYA